MKKFMKRGVAGKIGTADQVTVTVFGPVANLAARLEGMTKQVQAPILIDAATAIAVQTARTLRVEGRAKEARNEQLQEPMLVSFQIVW